MCLWSIPSHVAARGPRGEGRRGEGVRNGDWTHSCGKEDLAWRCSADPHSPISMWLCVCGHVKEGGVCGNEIQNAKYVGEVNHA